MSGNVRKQTAGKRPVRFTESPLTVYETEEWNPLMCLPEEDIQGDLDLDFIEGLGIQTSTMLREYGMPVDLSDDRVEGEEVGDDRVDFSLSASKLATGLVVQEQVLGMRTSKRDTFLSASLWNFCEVTGMVPCSPDESFDRARKTGEFERLGFIDVPPLRIVLDVHKGDMSHSSTSVGKSTMLGSRSRTTRSEFSSDWHLASYLQDGLLRTSRSAEPKYLPQIMGGSGVRSLYANPENLYLYVHAYRGGTCQRIYGSATRELRQSLESLEEKRVIMPILCRRLRDRQEYLHGTYAEKIFVPRKEYIASFAERLPAPLLRESGGSNLFASFENRLVRTRHVVTRSTAEREWEVTSQIRSRLLQRYRTVKEALDRDSFERKRSRSEFNGALNANVALSNLLDRKGSIEDVIALTNENFHVVKCGSTHFSRWDAEWIFFGGKSENFSIEDLTSSEDLFLRTEVSEDESLRVGNIPLRPLIKSLKEVRTTTTVGLYQIGAGMYEWAADLTERLVNLRQRLGRPLERDDALGEYKVNPEWINDDSLIIARCLRDTGGRAQRSTSVYLVSSDKRLGNQLSNTCNVQVVRVFPADYIAICMERGLDPMKELDPGLLGTHLREGVSSGPVEHTYVDTGSVAAHLVKMDSHVPGTLWIREPGEVSLPDASGRRTCRYVLSKREIPARMRSMTHRPTYLHRRFRRPEPFGSETASRKTALSSRSQASRDWRTRI